jgi:hypothetical protein
MVEFVHRRDPDTLALVKYKVALLSHEER